MFIRLLLDRIEVFGDLLPVIVCCRAGAKANQVQLQLRDIGHLVSVARCDEVFERREASAHERERACPLMTSALPVWGSPQPRPVTVGSPGLWRRENLAPQRVTRQFSSDTEREIAACDAPTSVSDTSCQELVRAHHEN